MAKPPEYCPRCGQGSVTRHGASMDGSLTITYGCHTKWHGWPDGETEVIQAACKKVDTETPSK